GLARVGRAREQRGAGDDHPRRAIAALQGLVVQEGLLQRMELPPLLQALHRGDRLAGQRRRLEEARARGLAVEEDGAGAALALAAAVFGPGEVEVLAQHAQERALGVGFDAATDAVDG